MIAPTEHVKMEEGRRRHRAGDRAGAEALYGEVLAANPDNLEALSRLAFLLGQARRFAEADALLDRAIRLRPTPDALFLRAYALQMQARYHDALACLDRA